MAATADTLRRTPLFDRHQAAGARLVPFSGWEMPVQYEGVRPEHLAVRTGAGMFDVSHMGQVEVAGPDSEGFLQRAVSNDVTRLQDGGAQYSVLCNDGGGVLDDLFGYRLGEDEQGSPRFLYVTNAANHDRDHARFQELAPGFGAKVRDVADRYAMLAVQGPQARDAVSALLDDDGAELPKRMCTATLALVGEPCLVCGTGYTGEDGVEILCPPDHAPALWDALLDRSVVPVGLGARDTLRLEACFHLYGNDLSEDRSPIEAGLGWACKLDTGFAGSEALKTAGNPADKLVPFAFTGPGIPRQGNPVHTPAGDGVVTSGTHSPCLEQGVGLAYVPADAAKPGTAIEVDVRGRSRSAEVRKRPLYPPREEG